MPGIRTTAGAGLLALALLTAPLHASPIRAFFGPPHRGPDLMDRFLEFAGAAEETLDLAAYEIRHAAAVDGLLALHARGVRVRVVVDDDHYHLHTDDGERLEGFTNPFVSRLLEAGVEVRQDDDRSGLMHDKFAIRDGRAVWTGSFNLTDTGAAVNANNAVVLESSELAALYTAEFEEMFVDGLFGVRSPPSEHHEVDVGGSRVEAWFGPEDDPAARTRELIEGAQEEVLFMQFAFTAGELSDALIERKRAVEGFQSFGILDRILHRSTGPYNEFAKLTDAGIPVVIHAGLEGKMHHKVFVIDAKGDAPKVVVGSANASASGNETNDENMLVIHDADIAKEFRKEFFQRFGDLSRARASIFLEGLPIARRVVPEAELVLVSGGRRVEEIEIELPARWDAREPPEIQVDQNGRVITGEVGLEIEGDRILRITRPAMTAYGRDAYMVVRFRNLRLPDLEGGYALYIRVRNSSDVWEPLRRQPSIEVLPDLAPSTVALLFETLRRQHRRIRELDRLPEEDRARALRLFTASFEQVRRYLVESVREDRLTLVRKLLTFLDGLPPSDRDALRTLIGRSRSLVRSLNAAARRGAPGADELAARLREYLGAPTPVDLQEAD